MKILMSLVFYPRGGSAQVARYLSRALMEEGHDVHLISGTLKDRSSHHDAEIFFSGIPLTTVDYTQAWQGFLQGRDPLATDWEVPFHPSYEDKPDVPDRVFYKVGDTEYEGLVRCWEGVLGEVKQGFQPDILHLHHLTHAHRAAARVFPSVPKVTQLHGTEIKMLERLDELARVSEAPPHFQHVARRMLSEAIDISDHFAAISPDIRTRAVERLGIDEARITTIPNGVDTTLFQPQGWSSDQKMEFLKTILVEEPRGWDESGEPGSIRYGPSDLARLQTESGSLKPLAIFVGRFLDFKRVPMLVRAIAEANGSSADPSNPPFNLLIWGGMPGEWEGEHPHKVAKALDLPNVFFCGWLPHEILSKGLDVADVLVAPSYNEPFGQVYIEAMAAGLPVVATRSGGPLDFVVDEGPDANGWFSDVDDVHSLAETLRQALLDKEERKRRGDNAMELIRNEYDWRAIARRYVDLYLGQKD